MRKKAKRRKPEEGRHKPFYNTKTSKTKKVKKKSPAKKKRTVNSVDYTSRSVVTPRRK